MYGRKHPPGLVSDVRGAGDSAWWGRVGNCRGEDSNAAATLWAHSPLCARSGARARSGAGGCGYSAHGVAALVRRAGGG